MTKKSIIISAKHHKELSKLSTAYKMPYGAFVESMILYFKKTGINPNEPANENPSALIKTLDKRIVSFLKVQERDILNPMRNEVYESTKQQEDNFKNLVSNLNHLLKKMNTLDNERTLLVKSEVSNLSKMLLELVGAVNIDAKEELERIIQKYLNNANK
ncbi:hypothetical protein MHTCC0001_31610 [Flavobacteriaceae bacterium MHTCC 0001]